MKTKSSEIFVFLFDREIKKLETEISQYEQVDLWIVKAGITNSAGNLALHLCGNLQYYIGTVLGNSGYVRNRPNEFAAKNIPKEELLSEIQRTHNIIIKTLENLSDEQLTQQYPEDVLGYPMSTLFFIQHLFGHFGYHLGQINYHRRILCEKVISVK